jgi:hypothetical protein
MSTIYDASNAKLLAHSIYMCFGDKGEHWAVMGGAYTPLPSVTFITYSTRTQCGVRTYHKTIIPNLEGSLPPGLCISYPGFCSS